MFILHNATNNKELVDKLTTIIQTQPLKNIFETEYFLIQTPVMERWLSQQLAQQFKVWAHYQFFLPTQFFKQISQKINPSLEHINFDNDLVIWQLEQQLHHLDDELYIPLKNYLQDGNQALKRYQLATQIAKLFKNYQNLRPELLNAWQQGYYQTQNDAESWQCALWLQINSTIVDPLQSTINILNNSPIGTFKYQLPARLFIFGISTLHPLQLDYLNALAKHCKVHFFLQNFLPTITGLQTTISHPLMASLGQQGREFQQLLLNKVIFKFETVASKARVISNNLQQLQYDIVNAPTQPRVLTMDGSISIHACHSKVREIEILKNNLLHSLEIYPNVALRDIIVIAPDIQKYSPFINSIFNEIPHTINSGHLSANNSVLDAFIQFLQLIDSRFEWQEVLDLLAFPCIFPSFNLSEAELSYINFWIRNTYVRWGKSTQHKQQLGLPPLNANTWQASMDRLLMGYALASDEIFVDGILPYNQLEGSSAQSLGGLNDFIQLLFKASDELTQAKSFQTWGELFHHYGKLLFEDNQEAQVLYNLLADFDEKFNSFSSQTIELTVIREWLEDSLKQQKSTNELLRGQLTFSSINTVRGIPFKVIAILGMNEGDFPSIDHTPSFDLLTVVPQLGDPSERTNDRQQFLELLLIAEEQLIISYLGQSQSQNKSIPPSVIISELLEVMKQDYQLNNLLIQHPLQSFSSHYFDNSHSQLFSYSITDAEIAQNLAQEKISRQNWWQDVIKIEKNKVIEIEEIRKFYQHPQRYFFRYQFGVNFQPLEAIIEAREPFIVDGLEAYAINHDWIDTLLQLQDFSLEKLQAQGRWLSGMVGELKFKQQQVEIVDFVSKIQALELGEPLENLAIDLNIGESRLIGKIYNRYQGGSLFYRYTQLKGKDLLQAWLHHCLLNQYQSQLTYIVSRDEILVLTPEHQSFELLEILLEFYFKGLEKPNTLFVNIALDYVKQAYNLEISTSDTSDTRSTRSTRSKKPALRVAIDKLKLCLDTDYEMEIQRLYGNNDDLTKVFSDDFIFFCEQLLKPLWTSLMEAKKLENID